VSNTIPCFINNDGKAILGCGVGADRRPEYWFDLEQRQIVSSHKSFWDDYNTAYIFFNRLMGTPKKLMEFAKKGQLNKVSLAVLLKLEYRQEFLGACALIEKEATDKCGAIKDPCLEDGCAFEGTDETCLNAVLLSEGKCLKACTDVWIAIFQYPQNRIETWRN